jgi:hypothetical protein
MDLTPLLRLATLRLLGLSFHSFSRGLPVCLKEEPSYPINNLNAWPERLSSRINIQTELVLKPRKRLDKSWDLFTFMITLTWFQFWFQIQLHSGGREDTRRSVHTLLTRYECPLRFSVFDANILNPNLNTDAVLLSYTTLSTVP